MVFQPKERAEAKAEGKTRYYTGRPCLHGHVAERQTSNGTCVVCLKERNLQWQKDNPDKVYLNQKSYLARNPEKRKLWMDKYLQENGDKRRAYSRSWRLLNPDKNAAKQKRREAAKSHRSPPWLSEKHHQEMNDMYWLAADLKRVSGESYHVDHIIPLQGKHVSGLHVPWNLQILPADINLRKSNSTEGL